MTLRELNRQLVAWFFVVFAVVVGMGIAPVNQALAQNQLPQGQGIQIPQGQGQQLPQGQGQQIPQGQGGAGVQNPLAFDSIQEFVQKVLEFLVMLATPFIIFMLIFTGFKFVMAQGNPEKLGEARRMFLWTIIGGMLILGASIIASVIKGTVDDITLLNSPVFEAAVNLYNLQ